MPPPPQAPQAQQLTNIYEDIIAYGEDNGGGGIHETGCSVSDVTSVSPATPFLVDLFRNNDSDESDGSMGSVVSDCIVAPMMSDDSDGDDSGSAGIETDSEYERSKNDCLEVWCGCVWGGGGGVGMGHVRQISSQMGIWS